MATYKNKSVTVVRDAADGDKGFDRNIAKVLIRKDDGTEEAVPKSEVTGA